MKSLSRSHLHNLSHMTSYTGNMGWIYPVSCYDVVPSDKIDHEVNVLIRTQPLLAPVLSAVDIDLYAFFSPDRLAWENSSDFHSGGDDGLDATVAPYMMSPSSTGYLKGSLADHLGLPVGVPDLKHSALKFRHYGLIRNEYFRDSQLMPPVVVSTADGLDTTTNRDLQAPAWKRDYFTEARPEAQLGAEVTIPLTGDAPVLGIGTVNGNFTQSGVTARESDGTTSVYATAKKIRNSASDDDGIFVEEDGTTDYPNIRADLSAVTGVPITDLAEASAVQRFLQFNNIWGGRYIEQIMARWGTRVPDYRLQVPEFLGAGQAKIQFSEVLQTAEGEAPVGEMRGHGISIVGSNRFRYKVQEHGYIMVMMVIRPKAMYSQGLHRSDSRETKFDYLLPEFQHIGDQAILQKEIFAASSTPNDVFGFTPMYNEYTTIPSRFGGDFHDTLDYWHLGRILASDPGLNSTFVTCNPSDRIFPTEVGTADTLIWSCRNKVLARRKVKKNANYRLL